MPNFSETWKVYEGQYKDDEEKNSRSEYNIHIQLYLGTYVTNYNKPQFFSIEIFVEVMK